jgi:hypothetical protein
MQGGEFVGDRFRARLMEPFNRSIHLDRRIERRNWSLVSEEYKKAAPGIFPRQRPHTFQRPSVATDSSLRLDSPSFQACKAVFQSPNLVAGVTSLLTGTEHFIEKNAEVSPDPFDCVTVSIVPEFQHIAADFASVQRSFWRSCSSLDAS